MKKRIHKLCDRKGIGLTEVVVAIAVVVIVTAAAISVLVASVQFDAKYNNRTRALNACESAAQCVRFADTESELAVYLARLGFEKVDGVYTLSGSDVPVKVALNGNVWTVTYEDEMIYESKK